MYGDIEITKYLINKGADVNYVNKNNDTAFTYACTRGHMEIIKLLLLNGNFINEKINYNKLFIIVYSQGRIDVIKLLTSAGYDYSKLYIHYLIDYILNLTGYIDIKYGYYTSRYLSEYNSSKFQKEILKFVDEYVRTDEYKERRKFIHKEIASDIFSQMVLVSDNYFSIKVTQQ